MAADSTLESAERVLQQLEAFDKESQAQISPVLENYLSYVASTGDYVFPWIKVKGLVHAKIERVLEDFCRMCPPDSIDEVPNAPPFSFEESKEFIMDSLSRFVVAAPFTIQRLCELLTQPNRQYSRLDKFMRALEKNVIVNTTIQPGKPRPRSPPTKEATERDINDSSTSSGRSTPLLLNGDVTSANGDSAGTGAGAGPAGAGVGFGHGGSGDAAVSGSNAVNGTLSPDSTTRDNNQKPLMHDHDGIDSTVLSLSPIDSLEKAVALVQGTLGSVTTDQQQAKQEPPSVDDASTSEPGEKKQVTEAVDCTSAEEATFAAEASLSKPEAVQVKKESVSSPSSEDATHAEKAKTDLSNATELKQDAKQKISADVDEQNVSVEDGDEKPTAEDQLKVERKVEGVGQKVEGVDRKVEGIDQKVEGVDQKVEGVDRKVEGVDRKVEGVDRKVEGIDRKVEGVDRKVAVEKVDEKVLVQRVDVEVPIVKVEQLTVESGETEKVPESVSGESSTRKRDSSVRVEEEPAKEEPPAKKPKTDDDLTPEISDHRKDDDEKQ
ncbi:unnamed protein product, partial [Cyprideis torosa]